MKITELSKRIPLEGTINTRDLGGYKTKDGRTIKFKRIIRTDKLCSITDKDIEFLVKHYSPALDIDLRKEVEANYHPDIPIPNCRYVDIGMTDDSDRKENPHKEYKTGDADIDRLIHYLYVLDPNGDATHSMEVGYRRYINTEFSQKAIKEIFKLFINNKKGSILYHCSDGKDRAGMFTLLLLSALGVSKEDCLYDYLKTNENTKGKRDYRENYLRNVAKLDNEVLLNSILMVAGVRENWFMAAYDEIQKFGGIEKYLTEQIGLTKEELVELRNNYLE